MANFFSSSGADDLRPDPSHPSGGDNFFSFKDDDNSGGLFFGDSSSSGGGGDHESFFKPSSASKNDGSFLDFGSAFSKPEVSSTEAEPTFLAPFSRTPPRKRQNQGPPPTPVCHPPLQHSAGGAKMEGSNTSSPQFKVDTNSSLRRPSRSAVPGLEPTLSSNSQTFGGALASPAQQYSNTKINAEPGKGFNEVNSQSMFSTQQQHGPGIGFDGQVGPTKEIQKSSKGFDEHNQQSKEMSSGLMFESKCGIEEAGPKLGREEKFGDTAMPMGEMGGSNGEFKSGGQPIGRGPAGAHVQGGHRGLLQQLLAKQTQHLAEMLTPELEKATKKEEKMVKELEQVEQEGKAYRLQLEGMKERFGGRLGQISGFLGLNTKK